jgi:pilus assembly protein CpaB
MVDCLVAISKIEPGTPLDPSKFRKETRPIAHGSANLITSFDKLRGAYAASFIAANQYLLADYVTVKAPVNEIQANIPNGYRAVAVAVDDVSNVEGWVRAGAKVDVLLASEVAGKPAITLLVQNAKVLSTGKVSGANVSGNPRTGMSDSDSSSGANATTITIMVTVEEATKIQLASTTGVMSLSLRGDEDTVESSENVTVTIDSVFGITAPQGTPGPRREGSLVVGGRSYVIQGGKLIPAESSNSQDKK